jgi:DNA adenine methylase
MLQSPIRWAGGKRWLAVKLAREIEEAKPKVYAEPFLGGGAVALTVPSYIPKVLSDINPTLMDFWMCVQRSPITLIEELGRIEHEFGNDSLGYETARTTLNRCIPERRDMWFRRAALFLYINARCFNGLWRTNSSGKFNVPWGKIESPSSIDVDEAKALSQYLKNVKLHCGDYRRVLYNYVSLDGAAIYVDPPYHDTFTAYAKEAFGETAQRELAEDLRYYVQRGAKIWTTNNDTELIREIYSWARVEQTDEHHCVGATGDRRGKRACLLIRGG